MNFQSHKSNDIKFHKGVNAIVGPSDCGKSAILRALRWVLFNDQPGEAYRRHGSDKTEVTVVPDKSPVDITRLRSNKDNSYIDDEQTFDKVKNDVPEQIAKLINMDDINVQKQMDAPFLLSENPPEVGRVLNRAAGIDDIDTCMSKVNSMERETSKELKIRTKDLEDLDTELSKYRRLPDIDALLGTAEILDRSLKNNMTKTNSLKEVLATLETIEESITKLEPLAAVSLKEVSSLYNKHRETESEINDISSDIEMLKELGTKIDGFGDTSSLSADIQEAIKINTKLMSDDKSIETLEQLLSDIEDVDDDHKDKKKQLAGHEKEFKKLMPDTCPLCQQEIV